MFRFAKDISVSALRTKVISPPKTSSNGHPPHALKSRPCCPFLKGNKAATQRRGEEEEAIKSSSRLVLQTVSDQQVEGFNCSGSLIISTSYQKNPSAVRTILAILAFFRHFFCLGEKLSTTLFGKLEDFHPGALHSTFRSPSPYRKERSSPRSSS